MANTITLSTDMHTVYLINSSGTVITTQSLSGNGAIINLDSSNNLRVQAATTSTPGSTTTKSVTNNQWTLTYHPGTKTLYVVGNDVIDGGYSKGFSIDQTTAVQIKRSGTDLILSS